MTFYHPSWDPCAKRTGRVATRLTRPRPELHSRLIAGVRLDSRVGRIPQGIAHAVCDVDLAMKTLRRQLALR